MRLVLDEAVANAIEHGGTKSGIDTISVSCQLSNGSFQLQVEDFQGRMFDPEYFRRIAVVKDWGKGGRGILLLESIVDHMSYLIEVGKHTILYIEVAAPWHESALPATETSKPAPPNLP
jgi:anti-sigma regulatory factor (Ser/Thr protein kinase)